MNRLFSLLAAILVIAAFLPAPPAGAAEKTILRFVEQSRKLGLSEPLKGIMAHAAACGDIDGDGDLDLYVGTFCDRPPEKYTGRTGPVPNMLLVRGEKGFTRSDQEAISFKARTSGAVFADLDNDGDLDLFVSNNSKKKGLRVPNKLFENRNGRFTDASEHNAPCTIMGGRSIGILDFDADGLLDLLVAEDKWTGRRTRLFRNTGGLKFCDASQEAGLPADLPGLGVITVDFNNDGRPDIFVGQSNRLFLSKDNGTYREVDSSVFQYEPLNREDTPCGAACGDVNCDGLMDIVIVDHGQPARQHLFINRGLCDGDPRFEEITREAGLDYRFPSWTPERLHLKHAHVEIADFDNDCRPDILVAATYRQNGVSRPFICRNLGTDQKSRKGGNTGIVRFEVPPVEDADAYFPAGPVCDLDGDGRLDLFLASWFPGIPSKLFLNRSPKHHWLTVTVAGKTINRMGIGAKVKLYKTGKAGRADALIGFQEIGTGFGFCTGTVAAAHFGLGDNTVCDVVVILPFGRGIIRKSNVQTDRTLLIREN